MFLPLYHWDRFLEVELLDQRANLYVILLVSDSPPQGLCQYIVPHMRVPVTLQLHQWNVFVRL